MIGKLKGIVDSTDTDTAIVDVGGVGYVVFTSTPTLAAMQPGEAVSLVIETHVREDHIHLFGFLTVTERNWFRLLTTVQGVGARMALAIMSVLAPDALTQAIAAQDKAALTRANGVGPKLAGRIITELKDKVAGMAGLGAKGAPAMPSAGNAVSAPVAGMGSAGSEDALSALLNLGYGRGEAWQAVGKAAQKLGEDATVETLIPEALRELA